MVLSSTPALLIGQISSRFRSHNFDLYATLFSTTWLYCVPTDIRPPILFAMFAKNVFEATNNYDP